MDIVSFQHALEKSLDEGPLPGMSAALSVGGDLLYLGGKGWADPDHNLQASASTVYPIASVTKTMTAYLLCRQLSEHGIDPNTPLREIEPRFDLNHPTAGKTLTVEQLIHHFGPLPPHLYAWQYHDTDRETFLFERMPHLPCYPDPVPRYRYSNILYALGGWLAGSLAGTSWEALFESALVIPLALEQTSFYDSTWRDRPGLAAPHALQNGHLGKTGYAPGADAHIIAPASEVISSVQDIHTWGVFALENKVWTILPERDTPSDCGFSVGSGWRIERRSGRELIWHSGQCSGYTALLFMLPESSTVCALLTNRSGALPALKTILNAVAGPPSPSAQEKSTPPPRTQTPPPSTSQKKRPPRDGTYENQGYGRLSVKTQSDNTQTLTLHQNISGPICFTPGKGLEWVPEGSVRRYTLQVSSKPKEQMDFYVEPGTDPVKFLWVK